VTTCTGVAGAGSAVVQGRLGKKSAMLRIAAINNTQLQGAAG